MTKQTWECWAYVYPDGMLDIGTFRLYQNEMEAWRGVRDKDEMPPEEIQAAKQRGAKVIRVRIEEVGDDN